MHCTDSFIHWIGFIHLFIEALPNIPFIVSSESKTAKVFTWELEWQRVLIPKLGDMAMGTRWRVRGWPECWISNPNTYLQKYSTVALVLFHNNGIFPQFLHFLAWHPNCSQFTWPRVKISRGLANFNIKLSLFVFFGSIGDFLETPAETKSLCPLLISLRVLGEKFLCTAK